MDDFVNATAHAVGREIVKRIPQVRSVVLIGSQARGEASHVYNEYDLITVVPTLLVPLLIKKIRRVEIELSKKYGTKLSVNPMPTYRIKHPRKNVLFYELKHGGKTLCGKKIAEEIPLGGFDEVQRETALEYLFNSYWILLEPFSVRFLARKPEKEEAKLLYYTAMKTFMRCCDVLLILKGNYKFSFQERIEAVITTYEAGRSGLQERLPDLPKFAKNVREFRKGQEIINSEPLRQWFLAKECLEKMTNYVLEMLHQAFNYDSWHVKFLNNLQFIVSQFIIEKRADLKTIGLEAPATKLRKAILLLSRALVDEKNVDIKILEQALRTLGKNDEIEGKNRLEKWESLKNDICKKWKYACTSMGW